jgi:hypothetical protein
MLAAVLLRVRWRWSAHHDMCNGSQIPPVDHRGRCIVERSFALARPEGALWHDGLEQTRPGFPRTADCLLPLPGDVVRARRGLHLCAPFVCVLFAVRCICRSSTSLAVVAHRGNDVSRYVFRAPPRRASWPAKRCRRGTRRARRRHLSS